MVMKTLEKAAKVKDTMDNIKGFIVSVGLMVTGALFLIDPKGKFSEIEEMAPYREWIGYAMAGFGLLFFLAIVTRGKTKVRFSAMVLTITAAGVLAGLGYLMLPRANDAYNLAKSGQITYGTATRGSGYGAPKKTGYRTGVALDVGGGATITLKSRAKRGQRIRVRYLPDNPKVAVPAEAGETTWDILSWPNGSGGLWAFIAVALIALVSIPFNLANIFKPMPVPDD